MDRERKQLLHFEENENKKTLRIGKIKKHEKYFGQ